MADPEKTDGAPPRSIHIEKKKTNWLAWIALAAGVLALLFALSRCGHDETVAVAPSPDSTPTEVVATTPGAASATAFAGTSGLGSYLGGTEAAPRTFQFEQLTFDTAKSTLRPGDAQEVTTMLPFSSSTVTRMFASQATPTLAGRQPPTSLSARHAQTLSKPA